MKQEWQYVIFNMHNHIEMLLIVLGVKNNGMFSMDIQTISLHFLNYVLLLSYA